MHCCCKSVLMCSTAAASVAVCCLVQVLRAHVLPLTNCAYNKSGDRFITGSYDRTCKVSSSAQT